MSKQRPEFRFVIRLHLEVHAIISDFFSHLFQDTSVYLEKRASQVKSDYSLSLSLM